MAKNIKIKLICLGAKNPEVIRTIHAVEKNNPNFSFIGFLDKDKSKWGKNFFGYKIFGGYEKVETFSKRGIRFCNFVARDARVRYESTMELVKRGALLTNLVSPDINLEMVKIGKGNYIQEQVILQAGVVIKDNSSVHTGSLVGHEAIIGNSVLIAHGCNIASFVKINDGAYLGTGVTIIPRIIVGKWSYIGAGAVIIKDVPSYSVVVGNPGRIIKSLDISYISGSVSGKVKKNNK